jgi:hypothetical protein
MVFLPEFLLGTGNLTLVDEEGGQRRVLESWWSNDHVVLRFDVG